MFALVPCTYRKPIHVKMDFDGAAMVTNATKPQKAWGETVFWKIKIANYTSPGDIWVVLVTSVKNIVLNMGWTKKLFLIGTVFCVTYTLIFFFTRTKNKNRRVGKNCWNRWNSGFSKEIQRWKCISNCLADRWDSTRWV